MFACKIDWRRLVCIWSNGDITAATAAAISVAFDEGGGGGGVVV